jgi:murein DD-endopeptidase MepM/ murein hydrolase activator NlpD
MDTQTRINEMLCKDLDRDIRRARLPGKIAKVFLLTIMVLCVLALSIGLPVYLYSERQETLARLREEKQKKIGEHKQTIEYQKQTIYRYEQLYAEGFKELRRKIERIENNSPNLLTDTKVIIDKFKNAVGSLQSEEVEVPELLFLIANHPESLHEAVYKTLIDTLGVDNYEKKYFYFENPLAQNGRTIVTSEFGPRTLIKEVVTPADLQRDGRGNYYVDGYGGGWEIRKKDGKQFIVKEYYHSAYDLVNDTDTAVYARHDGRIVADYDSYRTYGRTIFYEYTQGKQVYREQLSHLERGPRKYKKGEVVKKGEILGYMGETGNTTGTHLHWAVWIPNEKYPGRWITMDVYSNKILKYENIVYLDKMK